MTKIKYKPYSFNKVPPAPKDTKPLPAKRISPYFLLPSKNPSARNLAPVEPVSPPSRLSAAEPLDCKLGTAEKITHGDASLSLPLAKLK